MENHRNRRSLRTWTVLLCGLLALPYCADESSADRMAAVSVLQAAFREETVLEGRYLECARAAEKTGDSLAAKVFYAAWGASGVHATNYRRLLSERGKPLPRKRPPGPFSPPGTTVSALRQAVRSSLKTASRSPYEADVHARGLRDEAVLVRLMWAGRSHRKQALLFREALRRLDRPGRPESPGGRTCYYVCPKCGDVLPAGPLPDSCAICSTPLASFLQF